MTPTIGRQAGEKLEKMERLVAEAGWRGGEGIVESSH